MDESYANTVRLLLSVMPDVFRSDMFALKGGTAINLFVREMPRLSVDIDVVYTPWDTPRNDALKAINDEIGAIEQRLARRGLGTRTVAAGGSGDCKLFVDDEDAQVKIEVNHVFRGTVLPVEQHPLVPATADAFSVELEAPVLASDELYGSKLVAAFDRQHPRDIYDVWKLQQEDGVSDGVIECFVTYLAGHNRPIHEVLFTKPIDIALAYETSFVGMTNEQVSLEILVDAREQAYELIPQLLTDNHKAFLVGLARAEPDWALLQCPHASQLPALRWKLMNLQKLRDAGDDRFEEQAMELVSRLR